MKSRLVRIGNSRGLRLPKPFIQQAGLAQEVDLVVRGRSIVVTAVRATRSGWKEAAQKLGHSQEGRLMDPASSTRFDDEEWVW